MQKEFLLLKMKLPGPKSTFTLLPEDFKLVFLPEIVVSLRVTFFFSVLLFHPFLHSSCKDEQEKLNPFDR